MSALSDATDSSPVRDVILIGSGPAGFTAAVYPALSVTAVLASARQGLVAP